MTFDDLAMINLQQRADGSWSWTAYDGAFKIWRTNTGSPSPVDCIIEMAEEMAREARELATQILPGVEQATAPDPRSAGASGGIGEGNCSLAPKPKPKAQTTKTRTPKARKVS